MPHFLVEIAFFSGGMHCLKLGLKSFDISSEAYCSRSRSYFLKCGSHGVNLSQFGLRDGPYTRSPVGLRLDEAQNFQFTQGFAHRSLADLELLCYVHFNKPVSRTVFTIKDAFE